MKLCLYLEIVRIVVDVNFIDFLPLGKVRKTSVAFGNFRGASTRILLYGFL